MSLVCWSLQPIVTYVPFSTTSSPQNNVERPWHIVWNLAESGYATEVEPMDLKMFGLCTRFTQASLLIIGVMGAQEASAVLPWRFRFQIQVQASNGFFSLI
jgi:hypothetical protein